MEQIKSINQCKTVDEVKALLNGRYDDWYKKEENRKKRLEYYKEYYRKNKLKQALNK